MATVSRRIGPADNGRTMTLEEFLDAEFEEGFRYELGRGVIEVVNVPDSSHGQVVANLYQLAGQYRLGHPGVILRFGGGNEFCLWLPGKLSERNPDFAVVFKGSLKDHRGERNPALVVEVVSPRSGDRDYRIKREEYLCVGVLEYWIVDYADRRMTLLVRDGDIWLERKVEKDRPIPSAVLAGLVATIDDLWLDLEEYESDEDE